VTATSTASAPPPAAAPTPRVPDDHRGSWIPNGAMIATRFLELRKRRGLMIALLVVNIGIPTLFLAIRLILHAAAPKSYGPAGGYDIFTGLVAGIMYIFGFIVAAVVGCTAGSIDLTEGMFRHLVVTGRSRLALYLARIPAGLAIVVPIVASGFAIVCIVCTFAAPTQLSFQGVNVPAGLSLTGFEQWAMAHPGDALCGFNYGPNVKVNVPCGPNNKIQQFPPGAPQPTKAQIEQAAAQVASINYVAYTNDFLKPSTSLMVRTGLWLVLEAVIGLIVGLGLGSLIGQRTIAIVLMIVLELILTPILSRVKIPHLINLQRGDVGLAMAHIEPAGLPLAFGGGMQMNGANRNAQLVPETMTVAVIVICAWLVVWTAIGAWRMMTRDA
jgi:hypothetical protein